MPPHDPLSSPLDLPRTIADNRGMSTTDTAAQLHKAEARYRRAHGRAEAEREARNATVRAAIADGLTHAQVARATGLTRARVGQIADKAD